MYRIRDVGVAIERFAQGLSSADRQMKPKTAQAGGQAMSYAISLSLGAVEMPDDPPMEVAWDHWARRKAEAGEAAMALAVLVQLIPPPLREEAEVSLLGQIALWLELVEPEEPGTPTDAPPAPDRSTPEGALAERTASAALDDLEAARDALRNCLLSEADTAACAPQREAVAAAEKQLEAAAELVAANL